MNKIFKYIFVFFMLITIGINANIVISGNVNISGNVQAGVFHTKILNPLIWIDASDETTITSSGNYVSQIDDKSGNGYHATQASEPLQPQISSFLGKSTLSFNLDVMGFGTTPTFSQVTAVLVCRYSAVSNPSATMFPYGIGLTDTVPFVHYKPLNVGYTRSIFYSVLTNYTDRTISADNFTLQIITYNSNIATAYINGGRSTMKSFPANGVKSANSYLGAYLINGTNGLDGHIGEFLLFDRVLQAKELSQLTAHLNTKWGLGL
jgi:hypothetical protein